MKNRLRPIFRLIGGHPPDRSWKRLLLPVLLALLLAPAARLAFLWAGNHKETVELIYSQKIYPILSHAVSLLTGWLPFSLAEWGALVLALAVIVFLVVQAVRFFRLPYPLYRFCRLTAWMLAVASMTYLLFYGLWGMQYQRMPLSYTLQYSTEPADSQALEALCRELIEKTNAAAENTRRGDDGTMELSKPLSATLKDTVSAWSALGSAVPALASDPYGPPKAVTASKLMCYTQISGIFIPYTMEANVNILTPACLLPSTAAHEAAHQHGFAREDEANFLSYLACVHSDLPDYIYSGYLLATIHAMNALAGTDAQAYGTLSGLYSSKVIADLAYNNAFWAQYDGPVADQATANNDAYLKSNQQESGVKSYGRMVDLLLAEYKTSHGQNP